MKNDDEMYQSVLSRYEEYQEKKKKRIRVVKYTAPMIASICFCIGIIGYWNYVEKKQFTPQPDDTNSILIENPELTMSSVSESKTPSQTGTKSEIVSTTAPIFGKETDLKTNVTEIQTQPVITVAYTKENTRSEQETLMNTESNIITSFDAITEEKPVTQLPVPSNPVTEKKTVTRIPVSSALVTEEEPVTQISKTTTVQITEVSPEKPLDIREIKFGYKEGGGSYKPGPPQKIVMKCMSFCKSGEALVVDAAMADESLTGSNYDNAPNYQYEVYVCDPYNYQNTEDERFIANGEQKGYKKEYSNDEAGLFDIHEDYKSYDLYHHVATEIDFSNYSIGDAGCILFSFKAVSYENPVNPTYSGSIQRMYFYKGENGISVSAVSIENAMEDYQELWL